MFKSQINETKIWQLNVFKEIICVGILIFENGTNGHMVIIDVCF
jgi:hypothetical protein